MTKYMISPQQLVTVTHSGTDYVVDNASGRITRVENGFDSATLTLPNTRSFGNEVFLDKATAGDAITIQVKSYEEVAWTTLLSGIIRTIEPVKGQGDWVKLKCEGAGYGFGQTVLAQEYGSTSSHPSLDTIKEMLTGDDGALPVTVGIIPNYVNKILGSADDSGFAYTNTIEDIAGSMGYYISPYKPCYKAINDICDLLTAFKAGAAGPHWLVTTGNKFLLTTIGTHSAPVIAEGWDTYYGGSAANATLVEGVDFESSDLQTLTKEAQYIIYYGNWRRPSNGDGWTEDTSSLWGKYATNTLSDDGAVKVVNNHSVRCTNDDAIDTICDMYYPSAKNAAWDFSHWADYNIPSINFYFLRSDVAANVTVRLQSWTGGALDGSYYTVITSDLVDPNVWYHFSFPLGPYSNIKTYERGAFQWQVDAAPNWAAIDCIMFDWNEGQNKYCCVDGLHFGDAQICRVARDKLPGEGGTLGQAANKLRVKLITDNVGKDDSCLATDDSGLMAQMAYTELLRARTTPLVGTIPLSSMMKDLWPGQLLHIHNHERSDGTFAVDMNMRTTSLDHVIAAKPEGYKTIPNVTSDVINSSARTRYDDWNTVLASVRPDMQDRQAASIKGGQIDIRIGRLERGYA